MPSLTTTVATGGVIGASIGLGYGLYRRATCDVAALRPDTFQVFKIQFNEQMNHNTHLIRLSLPKGTSHLGLYVASCLVAKFEDPSSGKTVIRPYTPVSTEADTRKNGYFDLIIKKYVHGPMSTHITALKPGDTIEMKGPIPKLDMDKNTSKSSIGMVAGGTGISPMLQIIRYLLANPKDPRKMFLIFANVEERNILIKEELDRLATQHADRFKVHYTLDRPSPTWTQGQGYVNEEMIRQHLPPPGPNTLVMVCGPDPMLKHVAGPKNPDRSQGLLGGLLKAMGYSEEHVFKF